LETGGGHCILDGRQVVEEAQAAKAEVDGPASEDHEREAHPQETAGSASSSAQEEEVMALSTKQRNALPPSAFLDPKNRRFPVPTKAQARKAGISEAQRLRTLRNARSRAAQSQAKGVKHVSLGMVASKIKSRTTAGQISSVKPKAAGTKKRSAGRKKRRRSHG
jgi:hypothetical protein